MEENQIKMSGFNHTDECEKTQNSSNPELTTQIQKLLSISRKLSFHKEVKIQNELRTSKSVSVKRQILYSLCLYCEICISVCLVSQQSPAFIFILYRGHLLQTRD